MKSCKLCLILSVCFVSSVFCTEEMLPELSSAIRHGDLEKIKNLDMYIDQKVGGGTALHWAATFGQLPVIRYLVEEKNFDVNEVDVDRSTPLLLAITFLQKPQTPMELFEIVKYFISKGADVNKRNRVVLPDGKVYTAETPLDALCKGGYEDIIKYVVETKGDEISVEDLDSGIKALESRIKRLEEDLVDPRISELRKERTRKTLTELKKKSPVILKMLNDFKLRRTENLEQALQ